MVVEGGADERRTRRRKGEAADQASEETTLLMPQEASEPPAGDAADQASGETRRRAKARKTGGAAVAKRDRAKVKLTVLLPALLVWKIKHITIDSPGQTEGDLIAPWLEEAIVKSGHDFPRRPEWLNDLLKSSEERSVA